jgi:uncharacterized protein (TIGR02217 family)
MSDYLFPKLPGLTWDIKMSPTWSTVVQRSKNRATTRLYNDPYPLWTYELSYEFVRDSKLALPGDPRNLENYTELEQIVGFYNQRRGSFDDFLINPGELTAKPSAWEVRGAQIGVGDGTTTIFYLERNYGGFMDEVQNPTGPVYIAVNGVIQTSGWTLSSPGIITFATAPALNAKITWDGKFLYRVRFAEDDMSFDTMMHDLYELQSVKLEQVKL